MIAAGIDLGGTKLEAQLFAEGWVQRGSRRIDTPGEYGVLVHAVCDQIRWIEAEAGRADLPIGIGAPGLVDPQTGLVTMANLAAHGHPFPADIAARAGRPIAYINDCRAFTLSEAALGAGRGHRSVLGLILGTGVGGGLALDGELVNGGIGPSGEFGHLPLPADLVAEHDLPLVHCGCGRLGCVETLISGPGMARLAEHFLGRSLAPPEIAAERHSNDALAGAWSVWLTLVARLIRDLQMAVDPGCVVLGGGLSNIEGLLPELEAALAAEARLGTRPPEVRLAEGGDASGARGAAFQAVATANG